MLRGDPPERSAKTTSIRGSISAFAGRSGASRAQARTCNKRTARGDNRPEPPDQAVNGLQLPLFDATPTFQALVIILDQPPMPIPVHALPRLFERRGGNRGHQQPFQRFLSALRACSSQTRMTHTLKGSLPVRGACAWWQERHLTIRKAGAGSNALDDHAWLGPRTGGWPDSERLGPA